MSVTTVHFGEPTFEQKQMYTNVLRGIIRLSTLVFPENLKPAEIDALARYRNTQKFYSMVRKKEFYIITNGFIWSL